MISSLETMSYLETVLTQFLFLVLVSIFGLMWVHDQDQDINLGLGLSVTQQE